LLEGPWREWLNAGASANTKMPLARWSRPVSFARTLTRLGFTSFRWLGRVFRLGRFAKNPRWAFWPTSLGFAKHSNGI